MLLSWNYPGRKSSGEVYAQLAFGNFASLVQQTFKGVAGSCGVGIGHELRHGTVFQSGFDGQVDSSQQSSIAVLDTDNGTFCVVGNGQNHAQVGVVLCVGLSNNGFDESAVQLTADDFSDNIGNLAQLHDVSIGGVLLGQISLNGAQGQIWL